MRASAFDLVVVGAGNAAMCAALAAVAAGVRVVVLEAAPRAEAGGNSWFTDGAFRAAAADPAVDFAGLVDAAELAAADIPPYPPAAFRADLVRAGADPVRAGVLAAASLPTLRWLREQCGVPFELIGDNQSWTAGGRRKFFGNLSVRAVDRGIGLMRALHEKARRAGADILYEAPARDLVVENDIVRGVVFADGQILRASAVVLACGGFEADADRRAEHLGPEWRAAVVRGSRCNTGAGLRMALAAGADRAGNWGGCHAVGVDANAPPFGDFARPGDIWKKHSYPYGLMVNRDGLRFVDEGADLRNYTYAQYGRAILRQPGGKAWQIFDAQAEPLLRSEYRHAHAAKFQADALPELAAQLELHRENFLQTVAAYNAAVQDGEFIPHRRDGKAAPGVSPPKSNWALRLEVPPFMAFPVVCGITFTFGGVAVDSRARVLRDGAPLPGLYAAGEMAGGLFCDSYPGGAGLTAGAVFGKIAGEQAARRAEQMKESPATT